MIHRILVWYSQYQLSKLAVQAEIANKPYEVLAQLITEQIKASQEQSNILKTWLSGFTQQTIQPSSTNTEALDEYMLEQEKLAKLIEKEDSLSLSELAAANLANLR